MVPASGRFANREAMKIEEVCHVPFSDDVYIYNYCIYIYNICVYLKSTISPKNWWLEDEIVVLRCSLFRWHANFRWRMSHMISAVALTNDGHCHQVQAEKMTSLKRLKHYWVVLVQTCRRWDSLGVCKSTGCSRIVHGCFFSHVCIRFGMWLQWHRVRCSFLRWVEIGKSKVILIAE